MSAKCELDVNPFIISFSHQLVDVDQNENIDNFLFNLNIVSDQSLFGPNYQHLEKALKTNQFTDIFNGLIKISIPFSLHFDFSKYINFPYILVNADVTICKYLPKGEQSFCEYIFTQLMQTIFSTNFTFQFYSKTITVKQNFSAIALKDEFFYIEIYEKSHNFILYKQFIN